MGKAPIHTSLALEVRGRSGFLFRWTIVPRCVLHGIRRVSAQYTRVFDKTSPASRLIFIHQIQNTESQTREFDM